MTPEKAPVPIPGTPCGDPDESRPASSLSLVVLAAGLGRRYGGLKQVAPVGPKGETILDYSVYDALRSGFSRLVFVLRRHLADDFRRLVSGRFEDRAAVDYVYQELNGTGRGVVAPAARQKPWGTAHAVLVARQAVAEPFAVVNADDFYAPAAFRQMRDALVQSSSASDLALVAYRLEDTLSSHGAVSRGVLELDRLGQLRGIVERTRILGDDAGIRYFDEHGTPHSLVGEKWVSMNFWGLQPSIFVELERELEAFLLARGDDLEAELYLPSVVDRLVAQRRVRVQVLKSPGPWYGLTYAQDQPQVVAGIRQLVARGVYPEDLWSGR